MDAYTYGNSNWGDKLTAYKGNTITYDAIGNPLSYYNGDTFTWEGRSLVGAQSGLTSYSFAYNGDGLRISKTRTITDSDTTYYLYDGTTLIAEYSDTYTIVFIYDASGSPIGMRYRSASFASEVWKTYWYEKNLQGDIVAIYSNDGVKLISYIYDAWGSFTTTYHNGGASTAAAKNPFKYRGYYYDSDLGLYYLRSRYYDPVTGRFINADGYVSTGQGLIGHNMYAYCNNNPIMYVDFMGEFPWLILGIMFVGAVAGGVLAYFTDTKIGSTIEESQNIEDENGSNLTDSEELTTEDRVVNTVLGVGLGLVSAGTVIILVGTGAALIVGSGTVVIGILGVTGYQAVAIGALLYNVLPMFIAPFFGLESEVLEFD